LLISKVKNLRIGWA